MMSSYGKEIVLNYMQYLQNTAEKASTTKIDRVGKAAQTNQNL